jgi:hypothetical protein
VGPPLFRARATHRLLEAGTRRGSAPGSRRGTVTGPRRVTTVGPPEGGGCRHRLSAWQKPDLRRAGQPRDDQRELPRRRGAGRGCRAAPWGVATRPGPGDGWMGAPGWGDGGSPRPQAVVRVTQVRRACTAQKSHAAIGNRVDRHLAILDRCRPIRRRIVDDTSPDDPSGLAPVRLREGRLQWTRSTGSASGRAGAAGAAPASFPSCSAHIVYRAAISQASDSTA